MVGRMLRQYRIEAKLGAGGTGVVYRARDTRLDRAVAIKILSAAAPANAEPGERFAQKLKSASLLSHPNIVAIYDIDVAEVDGRQATWIAMEYVAGKTLDKFIGRRGLPLSDALGWAVEIADGLAAAHSLGIVHSNLNPASIIVTKQGEVKILGFGLAGLKEPAERTAYSSPEEADGPAADERSDIFSFGAILYEMISGRRASVLNDDPRPLAISGEAVSRGLERIIGRCLRKDPRERWQRMASVKLALEDVLSDLGSSKQASGALTARRGLRLLLGLAVISLALAGGAYVGSQALTSPHPSFQRLTYRRGDVPSAKFSPDSQTIFFSGQWADEPSTIFSMRVGSPEYRSLNLPAGRILSISRSGEMAILLGDGVPGTLARVPISGGAPREVLEDVTEADWSPDGSNLAVSHTVGGRNRIEYPIGTVLDQGQDRPTQSLRVSPKGDALAFFEYDNAVRDFAVTLLDLHGKKRVLSRGWTAATYLAWSPRGDEIWFGGAKAGGEPALRAVSLNGKERLVVEAPAWMAIDDITRDGKVLATVVDSRFGISALAPGGKEQQDLSWFEASRIYDMSPDGKVILFVEMSYGKPRNTAIYLRKTDGSPAVRLGDGNRPALSPDGNWVACIVSDGSRTTLTLLPKGAGETRTIGEAGMHYERVEWFPDGRRILFYGNEPNRPSRAFVQDLDGGKPVPLTPEGMDASHVSPDGKFATVVAAGRLSLFPIGGGQSKPVEVLEPGQSVIRWSGDGRFLFLQRQTEPAVLTINRLEVATGRRELWKEIKAPDSVGVQMGQIVMTPDGASYAYSFQRDISTLYLAEGLR